MQVRSQALATIRKALYYGHANMLQGWLADVPISSFVATLLGSQDGPVISSAVQLAEILMQKQPKLFSTFFLKEGVAHAIDQLASEHVPAPPAEVTCSPPPLAPRTKAQRRSSSRLKVCKLSKAEHAE